jgi:hypothetical protein
VATDINLRVVLRVDRTGKSIPHFSSSQLEMDSICLGWIIDIFYPVHLRASITGHTVVPATPCIDAIPAN